MKKAKSVMRKIEFPQNLLLNLNMQTELLKFRCCQLAQGKNTSKRMIGASGAFTSCFRYPSKYSRLENLKPTVRFPAKLNVFIPSNAGIHFVINYFYSDKKLCYILQIAI